MKSDIRLQDFAPKGPLMVHCDALKTRLLVNGFNSRKEALANHVKNLEAIAEQRSLWIPTFNYDFCKIGIYNVDNDPSHSGPITEHFRRESSIWRSPCPVFNFAVNCQADVFVLGEFSTIDPFGEFSQFEKLVELDGSIVWYGAPLSATTLIHFVERVSGVLAYRYDKIFIGKVVNNDQCIYNVRLNYHVRPLNMRLDYDWSRIVSDLKHEGILHSINDSANCYWASAKELVSFWLENLREDHLYFLDLDSRNWVDELLNKLGRRFELLDFERPRD